MARPAMHKQDSFNSCKSCLSKGKSHRDAGVDNMSCSQNENENMKLVQALRREK